MKKWIIITIGIIILLVVGAGIAIYVYKLNNTIDLKLEEKTELANTNEYYNSQNIVETSLMDNKISPNAILIKKEYYKQCDHLKREEIEVPKSLINGTQSDIQRAYSDWKIESYAPKEIVIYKDYDGLCDEHYIVKEHNGVLGIYVLNENGEEIFKEDTEIQTQYLPEIDLEKVKNGITAVGQAQLNSVLEDFE